jgi:SAM-dependent methyltransferase
MRGLIYFFQLLLGTAVAFGSFRAQVQPHAPQPSPQSPGNSSSSGAKEAKDWWNNTADEEFQHLDRGYVTETAKSWDIFLSKFFWYNTRVLDYGIGAGYLGETLFRRYPIKSYVGVDISQKALDAAHKVLKPWNKSVELYLTPQNFSKLKPEIFVSQQVIQHFPTVEYLTDFLQNVDASGASELMLHFRKAPDGATRANDAYTTTGNQSDVAMGLVTTNQFLEKHLPKYLLRWFEFLPMRAGTVGVYTKWTRRPTFSNL